MIKKNFFKHKGKKLTHQEVKPNVSYFARFKTFEKPPNTPTIAPVDTISTLSTLAFTETPRATETINSLFTPETKIYTTNSISVAETAKTNEPTLKDVAAIKVSKLKKWFYYNKINKKNVRKYWLTSSFATFVLFAAIVAIYPMKAFPKVQNKYSIYASTPLRLGSSTYKIYAQDARSQKINMVFRKFNCPLEGLGEIFVYEADKHDIPWWLVAAVSFQESSCGKKTPEPNGIESYNAWGWAVYGDNVQSFDNWARGIETVSEYMSKKFYAKGIVDPCDIMKTYTPPSKGSWCEGVKYFGDMIETYSTPEI
jgi:hypothetical protein